MASGSRDDQSEARLKRLRKKLERLNRGPLRTPAPTARKAPESQDAPSKKAVPAVVSFRRDRPAVAPPRHDVSRSPAGSPKPLERCLSGRLCEVAGGLPFYLVEREIEGDEPELNPKCLDGSLAVWSAAAAGVRDTVDPPSADRVLFLDLETTGLSSSPVFLIGMLVIREGRLRCQQLLARTYAEERSIVAHYAAKAAQAATVITFNGKTFDVPFLRARAAATGVRLPEIPQHLDLLHAARRVYRDRLPNCRLQTLESHVCGRDRGPDIPGSEIPQVYHDFVRSGDARLVARVVRHNFHDLVTLAHLLVRLYPPEA